MLARSMGTSLVKYTGSSLSGKQADDGEGVGAFSGRMSIGFEIPVKLTKLRAVGDNAESESQIILPARLLSILGMEVSTSVFIVIEFGCRVVSGCGGSSVAVVLLGVGIDSIFLTDCHQSPSPPI